MSNYKSVIMLWTDKETGRAILPKFNNTSGEMFHVANGIDVGSPPYAGKDGGKVKNMAVKLLISNSEKREETFAKLGKGTKVQVEGTIKIDPVTGLLPTHEFGGKVYVDFEVRVTDLQIIVWGPLNGATDSSDTGEVNV